MYLKRKVTAYNSKEVASHLSEGEVRGKFPCGMLPFVHTCFLLKHQFFIYSLLLPEYKCFVCSLNSPHGILSNPESHQWTLKPRLLSDPNKRTKLLVLSLLFSFTSPPHAQPHTKHHIKCFCIGKAIKLVRFYFVSVYKRGMGKFKM